MPQRVPRIYREVTIINRLDRLLQRAKKIGGEWKPHEFIISRMEDGLYRVFCTLWNGVPGSLQPDTYKKLGVNPHKVAYCQSKEAAHNAIKKEIREFEQDHGVKVSPVPLILDCCQPQTDEERKEIWVEQGRTVMEYFAEKEGLTLEQYLHKEYGTNEGRLLEELEKWADIIRWRKEDGKDVEAATEAVNTEGSPGCCRQNSE